MKKLTIAAMATVVMTVLAANVAEAQHPRSAGAGEMGGQRGMMQHARGRRTPFSPGHLLRRSAPLELNEDQIAELTELRDGLEAAGREAHSGRSGTQSRMRELMGSDEPDLNAIREEFMSNHAALGEFQWARIEAGVNARNLLTDEQRGRVQGWGEARGGNRGHQMRGGRSQRQRGGGRMMAPRGRRGFINR